MVGTFEKKNKFYAAGITISVHVILLLILLFTVITTPIPPFPEEEGGVELGLMDFGNNIEGTGSTEDVNMGDASPNKNNTAIATSVSQEKSSAENNESVITNDAEPSVAINSAVKKTPKAEPKQPVEKDPAPSTELLNALSKLKAKRGQASGGDGNSGQAGNKGDPQGKLDGDGLGGNGTGGVLVKLEGRKILKRPDVIDDSQDQGRVVVEIVVNAAGNVISADAGQRGSTTSSTILWAKARQAALSSKFNVSPDGTVEQRGTMTFNFVLN